MISAIIAITTATMAMILLAPPPLPPLSEAGGVARCGVPLLPPEVARDALPAVVALAALLALDFAAALEAADLPAFVAAGLSAGFDACLASLFD